MIVGCGKLLELGTALYFDAEIVEVLFKQTLGVALRKQESEGMGRGHAVEGEACDFFVARDDVGGCDFEAGVDERGGAAHAVEHLEGATPKDESLGLVGALGGFVYDTNGEAVARKLGGHGESDGACADNEDVYVHTLHLHYSL